MNEKKIAFIMCVSNEQEMAEACYYIEHLYIPDGYEIDVITIQGADSMTHGYQTAMESTDAKYKVYMHQDVRIVNCNFIEDIVNIFMSDENIGLIGVIGCSELPEHAVAISSWNVGKIYHNIVPSRFDKYQREDRKSIDVDAVDGLMIATQYDIPWRTDLFDGWHYYDVSQCMEMKRRGYRMVVPYQEQPWCYHDNKSAVMTSYDDYRKIFIREYQDIKPFRFDNVSEEKQRFEAARQRVVDALYQLVEFGQKEELLRLFQQKEYQGYLYLKEYAILAHIEQSEQVNQSDKHFWQEGDDYESLLRKIREVRYMLKRYAFHIASDDESEIDILNNYSEDAIRIIGLCYDVETDFILGRLKEKNGDSQ